MAMFMLVLWLAVLILSSLVTGIMIRDSSPAIPLHVSDVNGLAAELTVASDATFCTDRHGNQISDGAVFIPGDDACRKCHCAQGAAAMCTLVHCSTPPCVLWEPVPDECCQFNCIKPSLDLPYNPAGTNSGDRNLTMVPIPKEVDAASLGIRLAASAVSSLLIVVLLLFMVQRLRQRRLLITMRRLYNENRSSDDFVAYATSVEQSDVGFDFPSYDEPPPPYSVMNKPSDDEPPPYDQITEESTGIVTGAINNVSTSQEEVLPSGSDETNMGDCISHRPGAFTYCVTPADIGAVRGRAVKCWLVGNASDVKFEACESFELQNLTSPSAQLGVASPSNVGVTVGARARERPVRKKCGKCRHSADATLNTNWSQTTRPRSLQVVPQKKSPARVTDAIELTSLKYTMISSGNYESSRCKNDTKTSIFDLNDDMAKCDKHSSQGRVQMRANCLEAENYVADADFKLINRDNDIMLRSAPAEAFADMGKQTRLKKFQIKADYSDAYRPVSCDLTEVKQREMGFSELHSKDVDEVWLLRPRKSYGFDRSEHLLESDSFSSTLPHRLSLSSKNSGSTHQASQSNIDNIDCRTAKPVSRLSEVWPQRAMPKLSNECLVQNGQPLSHSTESISSICAETGEKKVKLLLPKSSGFVEQQQVNMFRDSSAVCPHISVGTELTVSEVADSQPQGIQGEMVSGQMIESDQSSVDQVLNCYVQVDRDESSISKSSRRFRTRMADAPSLRIGADELSHSSELDSHEVTTDQTATYEHVIDRILEQIEAARTQFGWKSSSVPSSATGNWHRKQNSSSYYSFENVSGKEDYSNGRHVMSSISNKFSDDTDILDLINSNIDVNDAAAGLSPARLDPRIDLHD